MTEGEGPQILLQQLGIGRPKMVRRGSKGTSRANAAPESPAKRLNLLQRLGFISDRQGKASTGNSPADAWREHIDSLGLAVPRECTKVRDTG